VSDPAASTRLPIAPDEEFLHGHLPLSGIFGPETAGLPVEVEFGSGKGLFLIESARRHPDRRFLGMERSLAYYRIARDRIGRSGLVNARVVRADAVEMIDLFPDGEIEGFHAYFLDPWPKKKQRKRRLLGPRFLATAAGKASAGALFRIVTDHADYAAAIDEAIEASIAQGAAWRRGAWEDAPAPPPTHYELKYRLAGRAFHRFLLVRE
jgi:tRNA (guanine-N7-)-methyltransferase